MTDEQKPRRLPLIMIMPGGRVLEFHSNLRGMRGVPTQQLAPATVSATAASASFGQEGRGS